MHRPHLRPAGAAFATAATAVALALTTACGGTSTTTTSPSTTAAASGSTAPSTTAGGGSGVVPNGLTYPTIAALAKALNDAQITCTLEYAGLKDDVSKVELSICTIDGEQAYLRVWSDESMLTQFLNSPDGATGTVAAGGNWTISLGTEKTATKVANAIGGMVPLGTTSGSTP